MMTTARRSVDFQIEQHLDVNNQAVSDAIHHRGHVSTTTSLEDGA